MMRTYFHGCVASVCEKNSGCVIKFSNFSGSGCVITETHSVCCSK